MKKLVLAAVVAVVVVLGAGGAWVAFADDGETETRGACGNVAYEMSAEEEDGGLEVSFELQSAGVGETWSVRVEQDGRTVLEGDRLTDEDGELDLDVAVDEQNGTSFTVTATPEDGAPCTASLDR
jgi:hypothetical protein